MRKNHIIIRLQTEKYVNEIYYTKAFLMIAKLKKLFVVSLKRNTYIVIVLSEKRQHGGETSTTIILRSFLFYFRQFLIFRFKI